MAKNEDVEIIPPDKPDDRKQVRLVTIGQVKTEMADIYRRCKRGTMQWQDGTRAIFVLRGVLKAMEVELQATIADRALASGEDLENIPVFNGVKFVAPPAAKSKGKANGKDTNAKTK